MEWRQSQSLRAEGTGVNGSLGMRPWKGSGSCGKCCIKVRVNLLSCACPPAPLSLGSPHQKLHRRWATGMQLCREERRGCDRTGQETDAVWSREREKQGHLGWRLKADIPPLASPGPENQARKDGSPPGEEEPLALPGIPALRAGSGFAPKSPGFVRRR